MNREQLTARIQALNMEGAALNQRYSGFMSLYNAACISNNQPEMERHRMEILATVEQILDGNAMVFMLTRQLIELGPDFNGFT